MHQLSSSQITLLNILKDGLCHSGSELGNVLGITRSAIWKKMNQLIDLGIPINSLPQQGYQLTNPLILLNEEQITHSLQLPSYNLHLFTSIDSTNRFLKELPASHTFEICCAEIQTQGKGRFGRHWHSPFGENIYCSSRWNLNYDITKCSGLSLVTSLAIVAALKEFISVTNIKIKWPNDIYWADKKLCGSLIEIVAESNGTTQVIIGIGLNVNTDTITHTLSEKPWCSLYEITKQLFNRNLLIAALMNKLHQYLIKFLKNDLTFFIDEWNQVDYLAGKYVNIIQSTQNLSGIAQGINSMGQLILKDESGKEHLLSSGDTSLQARG